MSRINSRSLFRIPQIFQLSGGGTGTAELDDVAPVQRVLDVGRQAELNSIDLTSAIFFQVGHDSVHTAADSQTGIMDPYSSVDGIGSFGLSPNDYWVWLWAYAGSSSITNVTSAALSVAIPSWGQLARRDWLMAYWNTVISIQTDLDATFPYSLAHTGTNPTNPATAHGNRLPFLIPPGGLINWRSVSGAAGTIRLSTICLALPRGVYPPGLA